MARILVVDDEEDIRSFLADALGAEGHDVAEAPDGEAAWSRLGAEGFHLVLTDLRMPRLDGIELLRRLRQTQPEVEVIVLTAHGSVDSAVEAMKLGAFEYLQKPISGPAELRLVVSRALERRSLADAREEGVRSREREGIRLSYGAPSMTTVEDALRKVAKTTSTVLLQGESGTGKEVAARVIHAWSPRRDGPFVAVNCAALPESLLESELFGHEKGAFTGAVDRRRGRVELADGGTFFLDEIGELKPDLQAALLRVLENRSFERVGGSQTLRVDVRWIAATNRDLQAMIADGRFRDDLYHRLSVFPIHLPPLRERRDDILPLAETLLPAIARRIGIAEPSLTPEAARHLAAAPWPGNVRELGNALERAVILADGAPIAPAHLTTGSTGTAPSDTPTDGTLADLERAAVVRALQRWDGNRKQAAEALGIGLRTLYDKLKRYEID